MTQEQFNALSAQGEVIPGFPRLQRREPSARETFVNKTFAHFHSLAGYYPTGVFMFAPDTYTLNYLQDTYNIEYCTGYCWDQWQIDNMTMRGGWQAPYYASRNHVIVPSKTNGLVMFPHQTWDWIERFWTHHSYTLHPASNSRVVDDPSSYSVDLIDKTLSGLKPFPYVQFMWEYGFGTPTLPLEYFRQYILNITDSFPASEFSTLAEICSKFRSQYSTNPEYEITFTSVLGNTVEWLWNSDYRIARVEDKVYSYIDYSKQEPDKYLVQSGWPVDMSLSFELDGLGGGVLNPTPMDAPLSYNGDLHEFPDFFYPE